VSQVIKLFVEIKKQYCRIYSFFPFNFILEIINYFKR